MRTIQYAVDTETGLVISRVGSEFAWPQLRILIGRFGGFQS